MRLILPILLLAPLLLSSGCAPPDPTADQAPVDVRVGGGNGEGAAARDLGKLDIGVIDAELQCLRTHFMTEPDKLARFSERLLLNWGLTLEQFEGYQAMVKGETKNWTKRVAEATKKRKKELCPKGTISEANLIALKLEGEHPASSASSNDGADEEVGGEQGSGGDKNSENESN